MGDARGGIGVFDSGVGGISVLRALVRELPSERFSYFGDSANAPYGERTTDEVVDLSKSIVDRLLGEGCKAIVVACNTATAAAAETIRRENPHVPVVGIEPAVKPAALSCPGGRVLVMATPMTLALPKFRSLLDRWSDAAEIVPAPCPGLAARIEEGRLGEPDVAELVESLVGRHRGSVDVAVLGCTHYPFVRRQIREALGGVPLFDGARGTARQLRSRLAEEGLLAPSWGHGDVSFASSMEGEEEVELYRRFFLAGGEDAERRVLPAPRRDAVAETLMQAV